MLLFMATKQRARAGSAFYLHSATELFGLSRKIIWNNIWIFAPLFIVVFIYAFHAWAWTPAIGGHNERSVWTRYSWFGAGFGATLPHYLWYTVVGYSTLWLGFIVLIGTPLQIIIQQAQLDVVQGHKLRIKRLFRTVREMWLPMIGLYLITGLLILGGLVLLVIPGLIALRRYLLAPYVMLDTGCSIGEALTRSAALSAKNPRSIWGIIVFMTAIGLLNMVLFIGWFLALVVGLLYSLAPVIRYQELKKLP